MKRHYLQIGVLKYHPQFALCNWSNWLVTLMCYFVIHFGKYRMLCFYQEVFPWITYLECQRSWLNKKSDSNIYKESDGYWRDVKTFRIHSISKIKNIWNILTEIIWILYIFGAFSYVHMRVLNFLFNIIINIH